MHGGRRSGQADARWVQAEARRGALDALMAAFGCVEITARSGAARPGRRSPRCASVTRLDAGPEREAAELDPSLALVGEAPHLVDEWQEVPEVWDSARRRVDEAAGARGLLVLTGSTGLGAERRRRVRHSGAGRIARLTMRPMSLAETGDSSAAVSLASLFETGALERRGARPGSPRWRAGAAAAAGRRTSACPTRPPWRRPRSTWSPRST